MYKRQVKGLHHISSVIEPKDHLIAEIQALLLVSCLVIEFGQFIGPALCKLFLLILDVYKRQRQYCVLSF